MHYILGGKDNKTPIRCEDVREWSTWFNQAERQVGFDKVGDTQVSTVFLGRPEEFVGRHPVLFETMIIGGPHAYKRQRYCSWDDAEAGHASWVAKIRRDELRFTSMPELIPELAMERIVLPDAIG